MDDELIKNLRNCSEINSLSRYKRDLMKQAADAIEELQQITTHYEEESKGWWLAACDAKEERERLKEQIPRWIPVTERLPETHGHYFIWVARGKGKLIGYDDIGYFGRGKFSWEHISQEWPEEVTHWMPLPEPPEVET